MMYKAFHSMAMVTLIATACLTVAPAPQPIVGEPAGQPGSFLHKSYEADFPTCEAVALATLQTLHFPIVSREPTAVTSERSDRTPIRIEWFSAGRHWTHVNFNVGETSTYKNHWTAVQIKAMFEEILYRRAGKP